MNLPNTPSESFKRRNPGIYKDHRALPDPKPERYQTPALGSTDEGKEKSHERTRVRFTGYRVKPLDPDNFAGSVKDLLDGLRHSGLLLGDEPWRIILETEQVRVLHYKDERTEIEITTAQKS
jgi:hypothetical protein